jgi:hypothetical protein
MNAFWNIIRRSQKSICTLLFIEDKPKGELNRGKKGISVLCMARQPGKLSATVARKKRKTSRKIIAGV